MSTVRDGLLQLVVELRREGLEQANMLVGRIEVDVQSPERKMMMVDDNRLDY